MLTECVIPLTLAQGTRFEEISRCPHVQSCTGLRGFNIALVQTARYGPWVCVNAAGQTRLRLASVEILSWFWRVTLLFARCILLTALRLPSPLPEQKAFSTRLSGKMLRVQIQLLSTKICHLFSFLFIYMFSPPPSSAAALGFGLVHASV